MRRKSCRIFIEYSAATRASSQDLRNADLLAGPVENERTNRPGFLELFVRLPLVIGDVNQI